MVEYNTLRLLIWDVEQVGIIMYTTNTCGIWRCFTQFNYSLQIYNVHEGSFNHQFESHKWYPQLGMYSKGPFSFTYMEMGDKKIMDHCESEIQRFICGIKIILEIVSAYLTLSAFV